VTNVAVSLRNLTTIGICVLVAVILGVVLGDPTSRRTLMVGILVLGGLSIPLLLRWHHPLLIVSWNAWLLVPFLPGSVMLWVLLSFVSLGFSVLQRTLQRQNEWVYVSSVALPLVLLGIVTLVTMGLTGGFGGRALGQEQWGASKYLGILGAVVGFFALTAQRVSADRARMLVPLFFASGATALGATIIYALGPAFYILFTLFPAELLALQIESVPHSMVRYWGLAPAGRAICFALLAHYGLRGLLVWGRPWRGLFFVFVFLVGLFAGFRSYILLLAIVLASQFYFERLHLTRHLIYVLLFFALAGAVLVMFADKMPLPIQRALSFLPLDINVQARRDAAGTLEWRLLMWKHVVPEIPKYLWLGKGFAFSGVDYVLTQEAIKRHLIFSSYDAAMVSGAYHHGILTLIIPLGLPGLVCFFWFAGASLRLLHSNYKHGDPRLLSANTFLLAFFAAQLIFYVTLYGQFERDLPMFVGVIGLSICINGGVRRPAEAVGQPSPSIVLESPPALSPAALSAKPTAI
jgi:hypothetical protein